jgi:hypothetical protein
LPVALYFISKTDEAKRSEAKQSEAKRVAFTLAPTFAEF